MAMERRRFFRIAMILLAFQRSNGAVEESVKSVLLV